MKRIFVGGAASLVLLLAACDLNTPWEEFRYALVNIEVTSDGNGAFQLEPTALFIRGAQAQLPNSSTMQERCLTVPFDPTAPLPQVQQINGGDSVIVESALGKVSLKPVTGVRTIYQRIAGPPLTAGPTGQITVTTVGETGGFPAMTHSIGMVTPANVPPFALGVFDGDVDITWNDPSNQLAVKVEVNIEYPDEQNNWFRLNCIFHDDGTGTIPGDLLAPLRTAPMPRPVEVLRFRSASNAAANDALSLLVHARTTSLLSGPPAQP